MQTRIRHIASYILMMPLLAILFHNFYPHQHINTLTEDSSVVALCHCTDTHDSCCNNGNEECENCLAGNNQSEEQCNLLVLFLKVTFNNEIIPNQVVKINDNLPFLFTKTFIEPVYYFNNDFSDSFYLRGPPQVC